MEGFDVCSNCEVPLVPKKDEIIIEKKINRKAISVLMFGIGILFFTIFQVIAVIISYEFYWFYRLGKGGVSGSSISNVHPAIWFMLFIEILISLIVIMWGVRLKEKD
jgi:magnesium-transporting ATPase (P-type)